MSMGMMEFPKMHNPGKATIRGDRVTFSYLNSFSEPVTETKPLLDSQEILRLVRGRMRRFGSAPPGARESERSRADRKYISAQPEEVVREAWKLASDEEKMEIGMMLSEISHSGIGDPAEIKRDSDPQETVVGDDGLPLGENSNRKSGGRASDKRKGTSSFSFRRGREEYSEA